MDNTKIISLRKDFPYLKDHCFLNYAATCPVPLQSIARMNHELQTMQEPLGKHFYQSLNQIELIRRELAEFIGAHPSEIAFTQNTSSAVSTIALALKLKPGDVVLTPDNEFPSNHYPWQNLTQLGIEHRTFHLEKNQDLIDCLKKQNLNGVKVIAISAVSYATGKKINLKCFSDFCKEQKIISVVDAIQAVGTMEINCHFSDIDFLASGAQKWLLGPVGCGFLYAKKELLEKLFVPMVGWTSHQYPEYFDVKNLFFSNEMTRFEPGLPNYLPIIGMGQSLKIFQEVGIQNIESIINQHIQYLKTEISNLGFELVTGEQDELAGILCFYFPKEIDHRQIQEFFNQNQISVTVRENYIRVSPHFLTLHTELKTFIEVCKKMKKQFQINYAFNKNTETNLNSSKTLTNQSNTQIQISEVKDNRNEIILINGATGNLGQALTKKLIQQKLSVFLIGKSVDKMNQLLNDIQQIDQQLIAGHLCVDFNDPLWTIKLSSHLTGQKIKGLINCSGELSSDLFSNLQSQDLQRQFQIQFFAPAELMNFYIQNQSDSDQFGVLNVVSSSGRCGYPLLSAYASAHAALWTLTESIQREFGNQIPVQVYVADSMHSPLQKLMGRHALRYYRIGNSGFDYQITEDVACEVIHSFLAKKTQINVSKSNYLKILINAFSPQFFRQQILKVWSRK